MSYTPDLLFKMQAFFFFLIHVGYMCQCLWQGFFAPLQPATRGQPPDRKGWKQGVVCGCHHKGEHEFHSRQGALAEVRFAARAGL